MLILKIRQYLAAITYELQHLFLFYRRLNNQIEFYGKLVYQTSFLYKSSYPNQIFCPYKETLCVILGNTSRHAVISDCFRKTL